ncbi:hypothetical protein [Anabaena sp. CS-542/02]|uniref:hypothetical protein n=1 Tax=Anabaena sp. CS-542/02 TaxID=3021719 RepID=UPI00232F6DD3|nr:hypothetical protein [Anabaena sp. CS-542/02]MDB9448015.1 hypothetical protein [Anabaena sp. CS-542/02]
MLKFFHPAPMLTTMGLVCGFITLAAAPSYAGNEIEVQSLGDVIPACDILGQTVGRLVESVPGDGTTGFTRGRLVSTYDVDLDEALGEMALVGLSCNQGGNTMATITSPVQISGPPLDINVASTRAYIATVDPLGRFVITNAGEFLDALADPVTRLGYTPLPLMAVTSEVGGAVKTSDAAVLTGTNAVGDTDGFIALGMSFEVEVNGSRIPSGQYSFATTLSVVPR